MRFDATRQHEFSICIDLTGSSAKASGNRSNLAPFNSNIGVEGIRCGSNGAALDYKVEICHFR